jgi:hypothetical protein
VRAWTQLNWNEMKKKKINGKSCGFIAQYRTIISYFIEINHMVNRYTLLVWNIIFFMLHVECISLWWCSALRWWRPKVEKDHSELCFFFCKISIVCCTINLFLSFFAFIYFFLDHLTHVPIRPHMLCVSVCMSNRMDPRSCS